MNFRAERDELLRSLDEIRKRIPERERQLKDLASYAVKVKDYTAEAKYMLTNEIVELERLLILYIALQTV